MDPNQLFPWLVGGGGVITLVFVAISILAACISALIPVAIIGAVGDRLISIRGSRDAYDIVERYPVGADVTVFYDPANPAEASLER